ncbi:MAG: HipA domain-containing protein, partial [Actinobacteria bacterium]|nr:HipA domain-containing protein [Actinomycetota bacterium]
ATNDLRELWRRLVFGVLIRNTDDHLRNHGFLRADAAGWSLVYCLEYSFTAGDLFEDGVD